MLTRILHALPLVALGILASTGSAMAAFEPTRDELTIGAFLVAAGLMVVLAVIYAVVTYFRLNIPEEVEIPDHEHDHRYAGQHH